MAERDGTMPTKDEFVQLMDDPNIDSETKRGLALRYFDELENEDRHSYGFAGEEEWAAIRDRYKGRYSISEGDIEDGDETYEWYSKAKQQYDRNRQGERDSQKKTIDDAKGRLAALQGRGSQTEPGVANSNEILDTGIPGLDAFNTFLPVYEAARAVVAQNLPSYRFREDIVVPYDEQRDIPFDAFRTVAQECLAVCGAVKTASADQTGRMLSLFGTWQGEARNAAQQSWEAMRTGTEEVETRLEGAADGINRAAASVAAACRAKAEWVLNFSFQSFPGGPASLTAQDISRLTRVAQLGRNASDDDFKHFIPFMGALGAEIAADRCDLSDEVKDKAQNWAKEWLASFCAWFHGHVGNFRKMCDNTKLAVDQAWNTLSGHLMETPANLFDSVGKTTAPPPATTPQIAAGSGGASAVPPNTGASSGPTPTAAPPAPVPMPMPAAPEPPASAAATGESLPGKENAQEHGKLTVQRGDHELSLTPANADGTATITVRGPSGEPRDFRLDFGPAPAEPPTQASENAPEAHRPGPDGTIQFSESGLHIIAEQPAGPGGPTTVTVDDGTGEPATYTLEPEPADPAMAATPAAGIPTQTEPGATTPQADFNPFADTTSEPAAGIATAPGSPAAPAAAGLGTAPDAGMAALAGALPMMGPVSGGEGDAERAPSPYRTGAGLFDTGETGGRISGSLDEIGESPASRPR